MRSKYLQLSLCALMIMLLAVATAQAGPRAYIKRTVFVFGKVKLEPDKTLSHEFSITNKGDQDLLINKVSPG